MPELHPLKLDSAAEGEAWGLSILSYIQRLLGWFSQMQVQPGWGRLLLLENELG